MHIHFFTIGQIYYNKKQYEFGLVFCMYVLTHVQKSRDVYRLFNTGVFSCSVHFFGNVAKNPLSQDPKYSLM